MSTTDNLPLQKGITRDKIVSYDNYSYNIRGNMKHRVVCFVAHRPSTTAEKYTSKFAETLNFLKDYVRLQIHQHTLDMAGWAVRGLGSYTADCIIIGDVDVTDTDWEAFWLSLVTWVKQGGILVCIGVSRSFDNHTPRSPFAYFDLPWRVDHSARLPLEVNEEAADLYGSSPDRIEPRPFSLLLENVARPNTLHTVRKPIITDSGAAAVAVHFHGKGKVCWVGNREEDKNTPLLVHSLIHDSLDSS